MANNNPASQFPSAPPRFLDRGNGAKVLQPDNQVSYVATPTDLPTALTSIISLRAALITAGIMLPS